MRCRVLALWFSVSVATGAMGQIPAEWNPVPRAMLRQVSLPIDQAFPRIVRNEDRTVILRRNGEVMILGYNEPVDSSRPYPCTYKCKYASPDGDSVSVFAYINPKVDDVSFDVTNGFEELSIEGVKHCIRGNQRFTQTTLKNSYAGPFTAMFLGAFTMPYSERYPQRAGGCWGPSEFITTSTYTAYDVSRSYLDVQSIYILIDGDPKLADLIMSKIKFEMLNEAIEQY